ncbi:MAG: DUF692 family multinuclear iron-containing protein [Bdellovibrionales bacterium]
MTHSASPYLGFGLGLRATHYPYIFENKPTVDWFEIISENFMDTDGKPKRNLARIKEHYPIVMHGVSLSIGTVDPLNSEYLQKLKALADWVQPAWISDHLCWTGVAHKNTHDLLPVPYTEEALKHIVQRIKEVQDFMGRPIAFENPSTYLEFQSSAMPEAEFIARMAEGSGCNLLLDVNNVYVTCYNHRLDPKAYLDALPLDRVAQIHLSGHTNKGTHIIDTHDDHVIDEVWNLYKYVVSKAGRTPNTMVEWDDKVPEFPVLDAELQKARAAANDCSNYVLPVIGQGQAPQVSGSPSLQQSQERLQEAMLRGAAFDSKPDEWIRSKADFAPQDQLGVYINAYRCRLHDVTAEDYPVLKTYLGDASFNALMNDFVATAQSTHFNIARYATQLPAFIAAARPADSFGAQLCHLETAIAQLADSEETSPLGQEQLAGMTPDKLMSIALYPRKALQLLAFTYPVNAFYQDVMDDGEPSVPVPSTSYLAVFRHEDAVWRMSLEADEYALLQNLFNGVSVGAALESVGDDAAANVSEWFARWMRNGLLAAHDYKSHVIEGKTHVAA